MSMLATEQTKPLVNGRRVEYALPLVNLHQDADGYTLAVEMPGVSKAGVELTVKDGRLILSGHRHSEAGGARPVHRERRLSDYRRVFGLDPSIDAEKITASVEQGLRAVHLPKAERVKPRKVAVA